MMSHASSPSDPGNYPVRVLLVDDATRVCRELRQLLELSGAVRVIGEAGDGLEAVQLAAALAPDVVVMDLEMPVMDGYEATRQIKACPPAPRVVVLSVHGGLAEQDARAAGADSFIIKGTDYRTLLNAILDKDGPTKYSEKGEKT